MSTADRTGQTTPDQLSLGFPEPRQGFDDLLVTSSNALVMDLVGQPEAWPQNYLCIIGPPQSGLSSLAQAWAEKFSGRFFTAREFHKLKQREIAGLTTGAFAIDDAETLSSSEALLSAMNRISGKPGRLLLTSHVTPLQWRSKSADLQSRLNAMPIVEIGAPDELMMAERLRAAASRYYLKLDEDLLNYLVPRLELSYEAIERFLERLNDGVTVSGRAPSIPLAKEILDAMREAAAGSS